METTTVPIASSDIEYLQALLVERSGHVISTQQAYLFETKLKPVLDAEGMTSVHQLVAKMRTSPSCRIADDVTEAMTINESFFFRDIHPFETLRDSVLPDLLKQKESQQELSFWCGACSSGQEPYSIAITLRESFPELVDWKINILATDISDEVMEKADKGEYTQFEVNRGMPARMLIKYFYREGASWFVKDEIREMLRFQKVNLVKPLPIYQKFDLVFLRNVLIYFSAATKEEILKKIRSVITDDGFLFLGGGESLLKLNVQFQRKTVGQSAYFRPTN